VQKGEALLACPFGNAIMSRAEASPRGSIDAKIILWLKYFGRWNGARLRWRRHHERLVRVVSLLTGGSRIVTRRL
jgi:hypothetical protein